eukprot:5737744-Amphidinium_carterae.1
MTYFTISAIEPERVDVVVEVAQAGREVRSNRQIPVWGCCLRGVHQGRMDRQDHKEPGDHF